MKGSYILLIYLNKKKEITIGKLGTITFNPGWYAYVGSALNSLSGRINRHLKHGKKLHWHIDYFLQDTTVKTVFYKESEIHEECMIAEEFFKKCKQIKGFGCSDCHCQSHLFYDAKKQLLKIIEHFNMIEYPKQNT
jgi:Uri superfamily endonuclease